MIMTEAGYALKKAINDHSWYEGKEFVNFEDRIFIIRNLNYATGDFEFKFTDNQYGVWERSSVIMDTLKSCSYSSSLSGKISEIELKLSIMRVEF